MFKTASFCRIAPGFVLPPLDALEDALQAACFVPCAPTQPESFGWVPPRGNKSTVFFAGDLIPGTAWVHLPITMGYDRYPEKLIDEKKEVYAHAVPEHWKIFYTHDTKVAMSEIAKNEKGRFEAVASSSPLVRYSL